MHAFQPDRVTANAPQRNILKQMVSENPALCAGALVSLGVVTAIMVNAVWYQPGKHPAPLFATRTINKVMPLAEEDNKTVATTKVRKSEQTGSVAPAASAELLREVQTALSVRGYYTGKLDGVYGSRTKKAINSFQKDHSLKQDGKATVRLLTQVLMSASSRPSDVPVPKKSEIVLKKSPEKKIQAKTKPEATVADGLVAQIQSGLRAYGYDDLAVDGRMGQQTATAIQRFQLDYGMKITGEASKSVLDKLRDIGAYKQG